MIHNTPILSPTLHDCLFYLILEYYSSLGQSHQLCRQQSPRLSFLQGLLGQGRFHGRRFARRFLGRYEHGRSHSAQRQCRRGLFFQQSLGRAGCGKCRFQRRAISAQSVGTLVRTTRYEGYQSFVGCRYTRIGHVSLNAVVTAMSDTVVV